MEEGSLVRAEAFAIDQRRNSRRPAEREGKKSEGMKDWVSPRKAPDPHCCCVSLAPFLK